MSSVFATKQNKKANENQHDTMNEEDEDYNVDRFLIPFAIKNKEHMVNAIQINVNDTNEKFTPHYNPSIHQVLSYIEEYCNILQQNGKQCLNQQQIKQKVESFFEDDENWALANSKSRDVILKKILSAKQFQEFKHHNMIDFEAVDGGSRRSRKTSRKTRRRTRKGSKKSRKTTRKTKIPTRRLM
jgi:hypothetical protein